MQSIKRRRELLQPPSSILDEEKETYFPGTFTDFNDCVMNTFEDSILNYGNPKNYLSNLRSSLKTNTSSSEKFKPLVRNIRSARILSEESTSFLHMQEFDEKQFAEIIFGNQNIEQILLAIESLKNDTEGRYQSQTLSIAENIHNYAKALSDLLEEGERAKTKEFFENVVKQLLNKILTTVGKTKEFFEPIQNQTIEASNASALLSRISSYSFLLTLPTEIDNYCSIGQYDEIIRIAQKTKQYQYLESIPLFSKALHVINSSLKKLCFLLKENLKRMTLQTFNKDRCRLILDNQNEDNPIIELLQSIKNKVEISFKQNNFELSCQQFENSLPFWKQICDFYKEYNENNYENDSRKINCLLYQMIDFFDKNNRSQLEKISKNNKDDEFNKKFHLSVYRTGLIWNISDIPESAEEQVKKTIDNLHVWYIKQIFSKFSLIIQTQNSGVKLKEYILGIIEVGDFFTHEEFQYVFTNLFYMFYDFIHEHYIEDEIQIVQSIKSLKQMTEESFYEIIYNCSMKNKCNINNEYFHQIRITGHGLMNILIEKIIKKLIIDINNQICCFFKSLYYENQTIQDDNFTPKIYGWIIYLLNKCIEAKIKWGSIYLDNSERIYTNILGTIYYELNNFSSINDICSRDLYINLLLLQECFKEKKKLEIIWNQIYNKLSILCSHNYQEISTQDKSIINVLQQQILYQIKALSIV